ncbi:hypothetical protein [Vibrio sp. SCSIO 43136]|uniref:hypothetical protein n=1 Tax=Vibrio sp. SCSIO 43136 TaxID=2819101 RepID=UPI002075EAF7|nr:hypothetical protein [Vibrio sp. SCSIO 43136]USD66557.1 hypothetical protein J4N39_07075 [Vibrio sp. SCSIO 43136]
MKNHEIEKDFNLGGSLETALSGKYELSVASVIQEAWKFTIRHFLNFSPAILTLVAIQVAIFYVALDLQYGDAKILLDIVKDPSLIDDRFVQSIFVANFSYEVIGAPLYAGISLMAMSHAAGLKTKVRHITKGLQFTVPVILATLFSMLLQGIASVLLPFVSFYLTLAFSHSILLICEKRVPPMQSLLISLRAVNKKLIPIAGIYTILGLMFVVAMLMSGLGLIFVVPFYFHVKGVLYRNMFGIRLKIVASDVPSSSTPPSNHPGTFDA